MKLISVTIFSFAIALLTLALGLEVPSLIGAAWASTSVEAQPQTSMILPAQSLDSHSRDALNAARRQLATALQVRTAAEASRDAAKAHVISAQEAFEASMLEFSEAEFQLEAASSNAKSRHVKTPQHIAGKARETAARAEARLREAHSLLEQAEATHDQSEAVMSQARAFLQAVTARAPAVPVLFQAV